MRFSCRLLTIAALALLVTVGSSSVAVAGPHHAKTKATFELKIVEVDSNQVVASAILKCPPTRDNHPDSTNACMDIADANGRIGDIPPASGVCTSQFDPVIAIAKVRGQVVYRQKFSHRCVANQSTGAHVFNF